MGSNKDEIAQRLLYADGPALDATASLRPFHGRLCGQVATELPPLQGSLAAYDCRNNRLAALVLEQMRPAVDAALQRCGRDRVAVVMGTSTSGLEATESAVRSLNDGGDYPAGYHAIQGVLAGLGEFVSEYLQVSGPVLTVSTACTSSGNAMLSARRLLRLGVCDAVVVGGVDTLCELTLGGFSALEALSSDYSRPFAFQRDGINIGEAAAMFLLSNVPGPLQLLGGGASSDAHHMSAPHPDGRGAQQAMEHALRDAGLGPEDIGYINLHGTGTQQNDAMESLAVFRTFGDGVPCSSSKAFTGHTLGAAAALELAICCQLLADADNTRLPPSLYLADRDTDLPPVWLTDDAVASRARPPVCVSNSFAFGGNNVSLVVGRSGA